MTSNVISEEKNKLFIAQHRERMERAVAEANKDCYSKKRRRARFKSIKAEETRLAVFAEEEKFRA